MQYRKVPKNGDKLSVLGNWSVGVKEYGSTGVVEHWSTGALE
ncbi:hypothetical protein D1AOALGA4SA_6960 [Olavius algarvensis Delta 1 endosymbiont]|nr:hypothetical protein D1AOALGA4SA_6960 [Olavius algarvensis Delta 1 endosymbiont]